MKTSRACKTGTSRRFVIAHAHAKPEHALAKGASMLLAVGSAVLLSQSPAANASDFMSQQEAKKQAIEQAEAQLNYLFEQKQNLAKAGGAAKEKVRLCRRHADPDQSNAWTRPGRVSTQAAALREIRNAKLRCCLETRHTLVCSRPGFCPSCLNLQFLHTRRLRAGQQIASNAVLSLRAARYDAICVKR